MIVIGIDPGPEKAGYCILDSNGTPVRHGVCPCHEILSMADEAAIFPSLWGIEMITSYGMPVGREVFDTCVWVGRFYQHVLERDPAGRAPTLVPRADVRRHLCHSSRANDATVRQALIDLYGPGKDKAIGYKKVPGPLYGVTGHAWAALAVAVTLRDRDINQLSIPPAVNAGPGRPAGG